MASLRRSYRAFNKIGLVLFLMTCLGTVLYYKKRNVSILGKSDTEKAPVFHRFADESTYGKPRVDSDPTNWNADINQTEEPETELEQELKSRLERTRDVCVSRKRDIKARHMILFFNNSVTKGSVGFCGVQKAGETFWRRIFQFISRTNSSRKVSSPFDISRYDVYWHPLVSLEKARLFKFDDRLKGAFRFFFARNPYSRLVSGYVDKILLLRFLDWNTYGQIFSEDHATKTKPCVKDVTFAQFIDKIVLRGSVYALDGHWRPIYALCDACKFSPHVIGKQETFSRDAKYILGKVGLQHLMTNFSHSSDEIKQMVNLVFSYRSTKDYLLNCFDKIDTASRLWKAFQINGHLPSNLEFSESQMMTLLQNSKNTASTKAIVTKAFKEAAGAGMSRDEHSKQKREMMVKLFSTLSKDAMEKLAHRYDGDFKMFGYEKYPTDLFPWRYSVD